MNAPGTARGKDTRTVGELYMAFELGEKNWKLALSDGARSPSRYTVSAGDTAALLDTSVAAVNSALQRARAAVMRRDAEHPRLDDLHQALFRAYVAAWDQTDIDGLVALARADAARTTLIQRLQPVGGGWVQLPGTGQPAALAFRPAFMN